MPKKKKKKNCEQLKQTILGTFETIVKSLVKRLRRIENSRKNKKSLSIDGPAVRVFANGPGDLGSIPGRVIPKTLKMELDTTLLNTQHYKVRFKGKSGAILGME